MCTNHVFRILNLFMFSLAQAFGINLHLFCIYKGRLKQSFRKLFEISN